MAGRLAPAHAVIPMAPTANYPLGVLYAVSGALCFSTAGLLMRWIALDPWEIVFWRCVFGGIALTIFLAIRHRGRVLGAVRATGYVGLIAGVAMAYMMAAYCVALDATLVANVLACLAIAPFLTAILGWIVLRERIGLATWLGMVLALAGILMIAAQSIGAEGWLGIVLALTIAIMYAGYLVTIRRAKSVDMLPATLIAVVLGGVVALPLGLPFEITWQILPFLIVFGVVQQAGGLVLVTLASRHIPAAPLSLIMLIESVGGVIWAWLGVGEAPVGLALGGVIATLIAVIGNAVYGVRHGFVARQAAAAPAEAERPRP